MAPMCDLVSLQSIYQHTQNYKMSEEIAVITVKLIITMQTLLISHRLEEAADYHCNLLFGGNGHFWKDIWVFSKGSWDPGGDRKAG